MAQSIGGRCEGLALYVAAAAVALQFAVPFMLHPGAPPLQSFYQEWTAFALGAVAFIALLVAQNGRGFDVPRTVILPVGVCILVLAQLFAGQLGYWQQAAFGLTYLMWSAALLCVGKMLQQRLGTERFVSLVAWALFIGATLTATIAVLQVADWRLGGLIMPHQGRVYANFGQPNHFANYVCLGLFSIMFLVATKRLNIFAGVGGAIVLATLADLSGSISVWVYLVAAVILATWVYRRNRSGQMRTLVFSTIAAIVAFLFLKLVSDLYPDVVALVQHTEFQTAGVQGTSGERFESLLREGDSARGVIWLASLLIFKDNMLLGAGIGEFSWNYYLRISHLPLTLQQTTDNAHNVLLHFLAELGVAGALLLAVCAALWAKVQFKAPANPAQWWMLSLVAVFFLHSQLEYPLWYAQFLGPFALLIGAADATLLRVHRGAISRAAALGLSIAIVWSLVIFMGDYRHVERLGIAGRTSSENQELVLEAARAAGGSLFGSYLGLGLSRTISVDSEALDAKLELNTRVLRAFPAADAAYRQSALLALSGDVDAALRHWDLASAAFPYKREDMARIYAHLASMGQSRLEPLVEYAASRNKE